MAHPEYNASLLHSLLHLDAVINTSSHGFLAKNMVSLLSKCEYNFHVQMIQDGDDHGIREPFAGGLDSLRGRCMKFLPGIEDESTVYFVGSGELLLGLWTWFGNSYNFTFVWCL